MGMAGFRYSQIIGDQFYGIKLSSEDYSLIDAHALAASHHFYRSEDAVTPALCKFHHKLFWKHLTALMKIVSNGDFSEVFMFEDIVAAGLHRPEGWNPDRKIPKRILNSKPSIFSEFFPDPEMFDLMSADSRFRLGENHGYDILLQEPNRIRISDIQLDTQTA